MGDIDKKTADLSAVFSQFLIIMLLSGTGKAPNP